jgi:N-acetylglutamate synthase-like GNAT family acetyltransferase
MELPALSARRATVEDLPALQALWQIGGLPADELEKFLTEFQVVPGEGEGVLLGAIGLMVEGNDALLHSEALAPGDEGDEIRAALWRRLQIVARNQGIHRLWTQEDADYWRTGGFGVAPAETVSAATAAFVDKTATWLVCDLIDPAKAKQLVTEQMAIWHATRTQEADELQGKIRAFRNASIVIAAVVVVLMIGMVVFVLRQRPEILQRLLHGGR